MTARVLSNFFRQVTVAWPTRALSQAPGYMRYGHYFVDSNVIIGYRLQQYPGITEFIEQEDKKFYYTETVLEELQAKTGSFKAIETDPDDPHCKFTFVNSGVASDWKDKSIDLFFEMWDEKFGIMKPNVRRSLGYDLTARQRVTFKNDLKIIIESSAACHKPGVLPNDELVTPPLLTNNMMLWKKFISQKDREELLETVINLTGNEHLLPVILLPEILDAFQYSLPYSLRSPRP